MPEKLPAPLPPALSPAQQTSIVNLVRRAAKSEIMPRFGRMRAGDIHAKTSIDDLVTDADTGAEAMIARALQIAFPDALVIGEEAVSDHPAILDRIAGTPLAFHIDPLDGTWNFARGLAVFGVIVAATRYGKPVFGLIYDPVGDDWVMADADSAANLHHTFGPDRALKVAMGKPLDQLSGYVPLHLFKGETRRQVGAAMAGFAHCYTLRCSAHEYRMIAQGHADFLLTENLNPWDHAAGALIAARAGAHVEMLNGGEYTAVLETGHLLVAPDRTTWNRLKKVFDFLVSG